MTDPYTRVYLNAAGESVDPYVQRHECPGCHKMVWLMSHRCREVKREQEEAS